MSARKFSRRGRISARQLAVISAAGAGACLALMVAAGPANAVNDPGSTVQIAIPQSKPEPPPDNGTFPVPLDPYATPLKQDTGLDTESIGLGVLGGLALGAAGVGVTYVVRRRHVSAAS